MYYPHAKALMLAEKVGSLINHKIYLEAALTTRTDAEDSKAYQAMISKCEADIKALKAELKRVK